ncbi:MAG TPA: 3-hydroxyacyl-ACP dehydratase FabZ, partial [Desulfuromonadales bacterium]|nr:3-hydroxyacyl-ACP dehydratase FabZ [Desulfuromonadales bacterium]
MVLNVQQIMGLLPHRYPFLLIDRIEMEDDQAERCTGFKNVTINEPFFQGHFPEHPIMPGVLILEAMAQVGGVFAKMADKLSDEKVTYFVGIDKARFRRPVVPGDTLRLEVEKLACRRGIYTFGGRAYVG